MQSEYLNNMCLFSRIISRIWFCGVVKMNKTTLNRVLAYLRYTIFVRILLT